MTMRAKLSRSNRVNGRFWYESLRLQEFKLNVKMYSNDFPDMCATGAQPVDKFENNFDNDWPHILFRL